MIRRKRRTAAQAELLLYKRNAPISIGALIGEELEARHAEEVAVIHQVHLYVFTAHRHCQLCHGRRQDECMGLPDQMHEEPSRAETRGKLPTERFNLLVCGRLCAACHLDVTEHKLEIVFAKPAFGFMGPVSAVEV